MLLIKVEMIKLLVHKVWRFSVDSLGEIATNAMMGARERDPRTDRDVVVGEILCEEAAIQQGMMMSRHEALHTDREGEHHDGSDADTHRDNRAGHHWESEQADERDEGSLRAFYSVLQS